MLPQPPLPPQRPPGWNWGAFLVYSSACFFGGLLAGLLTDLGALLPPVLGGGVGLFAGRRGWFETG